LLFASIPIGSAPLPPAPPLAPPARKKYTLAEVFGDDDDDEEDGSDDVAAAGVGGGRQDYERPLMPMPGGCRLLLIRFRLLLYTHTFDGLD